MSGITTVDEVCVQLSRCLADVEAIVTGARCTSATKMFPYATVVEGDPMEQPDVGM